MTLRLFFTCLLLLGLGACAAPDRTDLPARFHPAEFSDLDGWDTKSHIGALPAFIRSCEGDFLKKDPQRKVGPSFKTRLPAGQNVEHWIPACEAAISLYGPDTSQISSQQARLFFETWFRPWRVRAGRHGQGLFTGYYEPLLSGSRTREDSTQIPLLNRPDDLVMVHLGRFREDLSGRRIAGRVVDGTLYPYESRAEIEQGQLTSRNFDPIVWVDDPIDAFFLHIQGSGQVVLRDGEIMRVGYAGQNGHPYYAIGRELIRRGALTREAVSLQSIESWLRANPHEMTDVLHLNASYVFFRELPENGPLGAQNVVLTPGRSLAVDHTKLPYGAPVWLEAEPPVNPHPPLARLMIAQDTGGAIRGAVRGDVFWGAGEKARHLAGKMASQGAYWILLPRNDTL
mgnify:CR=1 FL=1